MTESARLSDTGWRQVLDLGEALIAQSTIASQRTLITKMAAELTRGEADLWLAESYQRLPGAGEGFSPQPASKLAFQALDELQPAHRDGTEGAPAVAIPLRIQDVAIGVLEVKRPGGDPFQDTEVELLSGLALQSAVALQAARQVAVERWRVQQLALVRRVSAQVADVVDLEALAQRVTGLILETFDYYYVSLFTTEPDQGCLRLRGSAGQPECSRTREEEPLLTVQLGDGMVGRAAEIGADVVAPDVSQEPSFRYVSTLPETRSEVALPLVIEGRVLGVLDVQSNVLNDFDETDLLVLHALADNVAVAVEQARLYGDLQQQAEQLSAVAEISRAIASILDLDQLFEEVVDLIHRRLGYSFVHLLTVDQARQRIVYRAGSGEGEGWGQTEQACDIEAPQGLVPWVTRTGQTALANDVSQDPRYGATGRPPVDTQAQLVVPLTFGDEVLGVLDVQSDRRGAFGEEDRFLLEALADSVAIAIRNANLYHSERWRRQVADSMREVAGLLSAELDLDQVLNTILTELERTLPCDASAIWLLQDGDLCLSAAHGVSAEVCVSEFAADASTWLGQALRSDRPMVRSADATPEPLGVSLGFSSQYSAIAAPLRVGDRRLGLLSLVHSDSGRYGSESRAMTAAFASYAAVAIENTRLYQSAQEQAAISTVMLQVAEAARLLDTLDDVLETVANLVPMLVGVDRCALLLWDEVGEVFRPAAAYGLTPMQQDTFDQWTVAPDEEPVFEELRRTAVPLFIYDVAIDSRLEGAVIWALGFESLLMLPLLAQGEVLGAMLIDYRGDWLNAGTLTLHEERLAIIQGIAHQAAAAVESTQLREAQQEEAYVSAALLQVAQAVVSLSDLDDVLSTIVRITPLLVGVDRCIIFLWDEEDQVFRPAQAYGIPREAEATFRAARYAPQEFPLLEAVRRSERRIAYPPTTEEDDVDPEVAVFPGDFPVDLADDVASGHSLLAVPLAVKGDMLGVMLLEESGEPGRSRERRLDIITGVADQAALAVQNYWLHQEMTERERLERELQLAREIQSAFIPEALPSLPGWGLAATWRAARQVAGDFYDMFQLSDGRLGLVIADVADKGMPAALFMVLTRTLVRAAALENASPAAVLDRVNDLLVPDARQGMFVTALYAVLDPESGTLTYANAGHNLPLLVRAESKELVELERGGMALGVIEGTNLEDKITHLAAGDYLVFYTDGVTEAFSETGEIYSQERLQGLLRGTDGVSAQEMLDTILGSVVSFGGDTPPSDDLTLIVLCRLTAGGTGA